MGEGWACTELEVFGCRILEIPRPDVTRDIMDDPSEYSVIDCTRRQSFAMQRGVYKQLACLTKLRQLTLGAPLDTDDESYLHGDKESHRQYDGLLMTLDGGLDILKDLKNLELVESEDMGVHIDREEEQAWVTKHWPDVLIGITGYKTDESDEGSGDDDDEYRDDVLTFGDLLNNLDA